MLLLNYDGEDPMSPPNNNFEERSMGIYDQYRQAFNYFYAWVSGD